MLHDTYPAWFGPFVKLLFHPNRINVRKNVLPNKYFIVSKPDTIPRMQVSTERPRHYDIVHFK
jgi:hypothetical protein